MRISISKITPDSEQTSTAKMATVKKPVPVTPAKAELKAAKRGEMTDTGTSARDPVEQEQREAEQGAIANEWSDRAAVTAANLRIAQNDIAQGGLDLLRDPTQIYNTEAGADLMSRFGAYQAAGQLDTGTRQTAQQAAMQYWDTHNAALYGGLSNNADYASMSKGDPETAAKLVATPALPNSPARIYREMFYRDRAAVEDPVFAPAASFATDEQAADFFYIWNKRGPDAAKGYYLDYLLPILNAEKTAQAEAYARGLADESLAGSSLASVATNIGGSAGIIDIALQNVGNVVRKATGQVARPIDYNTPAQLPSRMTTTIREQNAENIEKSVDSPFWKAALPFLYETGMSMADSGVMILLNKVGVPEGVTLAAMGGSAGTAAIRDAKERGATDGQALAEGIAYGIAEAVFEKLSLDKILKATKPQGLKAGILEALKQGFIEGSEETATSLANTIADFIIMRDKSEIDAYQQKLMESGVSEKEAAAAATKWWLKGIASDALGGLISGFGMGGGNQLALGLTHTVSDVKDTVNILSQNREDIRQAQAEQQKAEAPTAAPEAPQPKSAPVITAATRNTDPLGYATDKVQSGNELTGGDIRAVQDNAEAMQTLRNAGVLEEKIAPGAEGREQIRNAVQDYAAQASNINEEETIGNEDQNRERAAEERQNTEGVEERDTGMVPRLRFADTYRDVRDTKRQIRSAVESRVAASAAGLNQTSAAEIGLKNGTDTRSITELTDDVLTSKQRDAVKRYANEGVNLHFINGFMEQRADDGSLSRARGWINNDGTEIWVQADHPRLSWEYILEHEDLHKEIKNSPALRKQILNDIRNDPNVAPYFDELADRYAKAYADTNMSPEDIYEELLCDYRAGFDALYDYDRKRGKQLQKAINLSIKRNAGARQSSESSAQRPTLPSRQTAQTKTSPQQSESPKMSREVESAAETAERTSEQEEPKTAAERVEKYSLNLPTIDYAVKYVVQDEKIKSQLNLLNADIVELANIQNTIVKSLGRKSSRNIHDMNDYLNEHPDVWQRLWDIQEKLADEGVRCDFVTEPGKPNTIDGQEVPGGLKGLPIEYVASDTGKRYKFTAFWRNIPQMLLDSMTHDSREKLRTEIMKGVEDAYARRTGETDLLPYFKDQFPSPKKGEINKVGGERKLKNIRNQTQKRVQSPIRDAEKTVGALNLNSACPMFTVGNNGCYLDACYLTQMANGATGTNLFRSAWYTGELLQIAESDIQMMNDLGGLRVNGVGDTTLDNKSQIKDAIRHAGMRGLKVKIITKQRSSLDVLAELYNSGVDISHVTVQPSMDNLWIPAELDDVYGAGVRGNTQLAETVRAGRLDAAASGYEEMFGRATKIENGVLYRKYGFTPEQIREMKEDFPFVTITPRYVVCTAKEIAEIALNRDGEYVNGGKVIQTLMHGKVPAGCISDYAGELINFGGARHVVERKDGKWHFYGEYIGKGGTVGKIIDGPKTPYGKVQKYVEDNYTKAEQDKIWLTLKNQMCCQANDFKDACAGCQSLCARGCGLYSSEDFDYRKYSQKEKERAMAMEEPVEEGKASREISVDSDGNNLSRAQQEYFKDSAVRDDEGQLRVVYHGTDADFTVFDVEKYGTANGHPEKALFFTNSKRVAKQFANNGSTKNYYLNITKPLDLNNLSDKQISQLAEMDSRGLSEDEITRSIRDYIDAGNYYALKTYVDYSKVQNYGYDGVIVRWNSDYAISERDADPDVYEYAVFHSNQAKLTSNKNPTANEDIRFSREITSQQDTEYLTLLRDFAKAVDAPDALRSDDMLLSTYRTYRDFDSPRLFTANADIDEAKRIDKQISALLSERKQEIFVDWAYRKVKDYFESIGEHPSSAAGMRDYFKGEIDSQNRWASEWKPELLAELNSAFSGTNFDNRSSVESFLKKAERLYRQNGDRFIIYGEEYHRENDDIPSHDTVRFSKKQDTDYLAAVNSGDMETAQRMVDEAAKKAGYGTPKLYHGTPHFGFTQPSGILFATDSKETAGTYSGTTDARAISDSDGSPLGMYQFYANTDGMLELDAGGAETNHIALGQIEDDFNNRQPSKTWRAFATINQIIKYAKENGNTGVIVRNVTDGMTPESRKTLAPATDYVFFNPQSQLKSADPVTYDDDGNVIPLSERFNPEQEDIRYSREIAADSEIDPNIIEPANDVTETGKYDYLVEDFKKNGWNGRPVVVLGRPGENGYVAITGSHRIYAAREAGINVPVVFVTDRNAITRLEDAFSDEDRAEAAKKLAEEGKISAEIAALIGREEELNWSNYGKPYNEQERYSIELDPGVIDAYYNSLPISKKEQPERKITQTRTNTYELSGFFDKVINNLKDADEGMYAYDVVHEKQTTDAARERLLADFDGAVEDLINKEYWTAEDTDTAMGIEHVYKQRGNLTGDYTDFLEFSQIIHPMVRQNARALQAMAKYSRTAAEEARKAAQSVKEAAGQLTPAEEKRVKQTAEDVKKAAKDSAKEAAEETVKAAAGELKDSRMTRDALNLIREIYDNLNVNNKEGNYPVKAWTTLTGEELARRIASRFSDRRKQRTTMQLMLSDLLRFAQEHALPERQKVSGRTATDIISDYLNNRNAYAQAWGEAQAYLRAVYSEDEDKLNALDSFLNATISQNADPQHVDRMMFDAILESADTLGITEKQIKDITATGVTEGTVRRIADELVRQVKGNLSQDFDGSFEEQLRDAVRRYINGVALSMSADERGLRLQRMENRASRALGIKMTELLTQSKQTKAAAANSIAQYLISELDVPATDAAIIADAIAQDYIDRLAQKADARLQKMFEQRPETTRMKKSQRQKMLELIRLGGLTNQNVEDAVVDALGLGKISRAKQREIMTNMAQFADTYDAMEAGDLEGLRNLIRRQAAYRKTKLSRMTEQFLNNEGDEEYLRSFAMSQLASIAEDYRPRGVGQKISTWQTIAHLLNPKTGLRNVGSNEGFDVIATAANNVSMIPDMIMGLFTGKRHTIGFETGWLSKAKRQGAKEGGRRSALEVSLDVNFDESGGTGKYGNKTRRTFSMAGSNALGRIMSHLEKALGYELNVTDEIHKGGIRRETLESLARYVEKGYLTQELANEIAEKDALYRSFQDDTAVGTILRSLKEGFDVIGIGDNGKTGKPKAMRHTWGLGDLITKYTQVPGALIHRAIEFSPLGYAKALYNIGQLANEARKGNDVTLAQRKAALAIGQATTGTGLILLFRALAKMGLLLRGSDKDKDKNAMALKAGQGLSGTQLNLDGLGRAISGGSSKLEDGDTLIDLGFLEPLDSLMTIAALMSDNKDFDVKSDGIDTLEGIYKALENTSAMQTFSDVMNTIRYHDPENDLPLGIQIPVEVASSGVSGFVPGPVRHVAQAMDTDYRDQYRSQNVLAQMLARTMNSIPGVREKLAPKITPLGQEKQYQAGPVARVLNAVANPATISVYNSTRVTDELDKLYDSTGDAKIWPERNAPYTVTIGDKITLTPDERTEYQTVRGGTVRAGMEQLLRTSWYTKLSPDTRAEVVNWLENFANYVAKVNFADGRRMNYSSSMYDSYLREMEDGKTIEQVVESKYSDLVNAINSGISETAYTDYKTFASTATSDKDKTKRDKVLDYIDGIPGLTIDQKDILYYGAGYAESTIDEAPWNGSSSSLQLPSASTNDQKSITGLRLPGK